MRVKGHTKRLFQWGGGGGACVTKRKNGDANEEFYYDLDQKKQYKRVSEGMANGGTGGGYLLNFMCQGGHGKKVEKKNSLRF